MKFTDFLPIVGLGGLVAKEWLDNSGRALPAGLKLEWIGAAAIVLILIGIGARLPQLVRIAGARRMRYGSNSAIFLTAVVLILGGANWMASRYSKRLDLSAGKRFSLSEQSRKILASLKDEVTLTSIQRNTRAANASQTLLSQYGEASAKVKVEFLDPLNDPGRVRALGVTQLPTIIVALGERKEQVLSENEQDLTNAILKLTRNVKKTVCFAAGEGERDIDDATEHGYSGVKTAIGKSQYEVKKVGLLQEQKVPDDCTVLVIASPAKDLLPEAAGYVKSFVRSGGKAMLLSDPTEKAPSPNFESIFTEFGVTPGADVVVDASGAGQLFGTGPFMPIVTNYPYHEVTKDLKETMSAFDMVRSMTPITPSPDGVVVQELAKTSDRSWGESDISLAEPVTFTDKDTRGPLNLAAAITVRATSGVLEPLTAPDAQPPANAKEGRVIAVGDSGFASNFLLRFPGNQDLFLNMISWLAQDSDLISIRPKDPDVHRLDLTAGVQRNILIFSLLLLPGFFILWGIVNWWRRRS